MSDLEEKKLKGSGGHLIAKLNEEQIKKANLGTPELFLAPVGRINQENISGYFCNKCQKEFAQSPKIDYENPNETVSEELVLKEKGRYLCVSCQNVIGEYREFSKS